MKIIFNILVYLISFIAVVMALIVIANFFYIGINNYEILLNRKEFGDFGTIGDFFSGHINGFILLALIISLYFQRTSINQTEESIKQQAEANKTISKDLQYSNEANMLQTKEFITTNNKNEFNDELKQIKVLMTSIDIEKLIENEFKIVQIINNQDIIEIIKRKNYLINMLKRIKDEDLINILNHKFDTTNINLYINKNERLLKKVFIFNELFDIFHKYNNYLIKKHIKEEDKAMLYCNMYEFIMTTINKDTLMYENRFKLFEEIISENNNLFSKHIIDKKDYGLKFNEQILWDIILFKLDDYKLDGYYDIVIKDYELFS